MNNLDQASSLDHSRAVSGHMASSLLQDNDGCMMPSYQSKAVVHRSPKKILQDLEKRLLFAPALGKTLIKSFYIKKFLKIM